MITRIIREPLLHFLVLAGLIFATYGLLSSRHAVEDGIVVSQARIAQLSTIFERTWQRPPTSQELKALIDSFVKEEIYVREALRLGIDKDDTVIRRRLQMKMEFLDGSEADARQATDAELKAYLDAHADQFREPPRIALEQVYIDAHKRGPQAQNDAAALLDALRKDASFSTGGDPTLLPPAMPLSERQEIAGLFGDDFAAAISSLPAGEWQGPVVSTFGLHLVRVTDKVPGRQPPLSDIRAQVEREWRNSLKGDLARQRLDELLKRYPVTIEPAAGTAATTP